MLLPLIPIIPLLIASPHKVALTASLLGQVTLTCAALIFLTRLWQNDIWAVRLGRLCRRKGIANLLCFDVDTPMLTAVEIVRTPLLALFRAVRVRVHTGAREKNERDLSVILKRDRASGLSNALIPFGKKGQNISRFDAPMHAVAIMAASDSNFAAGLLFLIPLVDQIGKAAGADFRTQLWRELFDAGPQVVPWIPGLFWGAMILLGAGWLSHFIKNLMAYGNHSVLSAGRTILVVCGTLTRRSVCMPGRAVSAVETRQTLWMRLWRRRSCWLRIQGLDEGRCCCLIPAAREHEIADMVSGIFPRSGISSSEPSATGAAVRPEEAQAKKYYITYVYMAIALAAGWARFALSAGEYLSALHITAAALLTLMVWRVLAGIMASRQAVVTLTGDSIEVVGMQGLSVVSLRVFRGAVGEVRIVRSPARQLSGTCDVFIRPKGFRKGVWCRFLPLERAMMICERLK